MIPVDLYAHQSAMNDECRDLMLAGKKWVLMQGATGIGKSRMAAAQIQKAYEKGKRAIFNVPRRELVYQMSEQFKRFEIPHSFVAAGYPFNPYERVHICTIGTLVNRLDDLRTPDVVFDDEIHIGGATRDVIINHFKARGCYGVGLSATPKRLDGRGLNCWYEAMAKGPQIRWLIENEFLSRFRLFGADMPDFSNMPKSGGDYQKKAMGERLRQDRVLIGNAVKHYLKHAAGKLNVTFCQDIAHSEEVNKAFKDAGVISVCVDGTTPDDERKRIFKAFARREIMNVCSVELITTGFDLEAAAGMPCTVESMSDLRPTLSTPLQLQKWGRVLRKKDYPAMIFDHSGNSRPVADGGHGMPDMIREWSLFGDDDKDTRIEKAATPARQCQGCGLWEYPRPVCSYCGHVHPVEEREIIVKEGDLVELTPEEIERREREAEKARKDKRRSQGMAKTPEELIRHLIDEGAKNPVWRAAKILEGRGTPATLLTLNMIYRRIKSGVAL